MYAIDGYELFRNDETSSVNRPYHGTTVYSRLRMLNGYPYARNRHGIELTIAKTIEHPDLIPLRKSTLFHPYFFPILHPI